MPEVRNDDATLFCEVEGEGEPVTVFAHGLTNNRNELAAFIAALEDGKPMPITARDGRQALRLADAALESARTGKAVTV